MGSQRRMLRTDLQREDEAGWLWAYSTEPFEPGEKVLCGDAATQLPARIVTVTGQLVQMALEEHVWWYDGNDIGWARTDRLISPVYGNVEPGDTLVLWDGEIAHPATVLPTDDRQPDGFVTLEVTVAVDGRSYADLRWLRSAPLAASDPSHTDKGSSRRS